jgi:uncharacterized protein YhaN
MIAVANRDRAAEEISARKAELSNALSVLGVQGDCQNFDQWIVLAQDAVERLERVQREQAERSQKLQRLQVDLREATKELATAHSAQIAWNAAWVRVCQGIGTESNASPEFVLRFLETWNRLSEEYREYQGLVRRADGIEQDGATFARSVRMLAERAGLADEDDPRVVVRKLSHSLRAAEAAEKRYAELSTRIATETTRVAEASEDLKTASLVLEQLSAEARCTSIEQFAEVEHASTQKRDAERQRRSLEELLIDVARGVPLADFLAELGKVDEATLREQGDSLGRSIKLLEEQWHQAKVSAGVLSAEIEKINGTSQAVAAAEQADSLRSQLVVDVRRYVRVKLAESVLTAAMELYRQQHQGPTLERASNYVHRLSCGSLAGLRCEASDSGTPVLLGVRGSGETVSVEGMSEGLADQLYLALRLASLDQHLQGGTRLPFVVDDILIKFDDERSVATLEVLSELSDRTQVIFFTHHQHLVDLAKKELSPKRFFVQELRPDPSP